MLFVRNLGGCVNVETRRGLLFWKLFFALIIVGSFSSASNESLNDFLDNATLELNDTVYFLNESLNDTVIINETFLDSNNSLDFNETNSSGINMTFENETIELNDTNFTEEINESVNLTLDENVSLADLNLTNGTLVMQIFNFFISSFVEGASFSFNFFESILKAGGFSGDEYSGNFFVDMLETPNSVISGSEYSATGGSFGLLYVPLADEIASYCGDGTCDSGETCSSCSTDCGTCPVGTTTGGGGGSSKREEENVTVEENATVIENVTEVVNESSIPEKLFDIKMTLEDSFILNANELVARVSFESFGTVPIPINLTFRVYDSVGNLMYTMSDYLIVNVEEIRRYDFSDLVLVSGEYKLVLTTVYGKDVRDEFESSFVVGSETWFNKFIFRKYILVIIGIVLCLVSGIIIFIRHRLNVRMREIKEKLYRTRRVKKKVPEHVVFRKKRLDILKKIRR